MESAAAPQRDISQLQTLREEVRAAQEAYYAAAGDHERAVAEAQAAGYEPDPLVYEKYRSERQALDRYAQCLQSLADAVAEIVREADRDKPPQVLTRRELEILKLIAEGLSSKQIAARLGIAFRTVVSHRYAVMQKLDVHDVVALVRYSIRHKIVDF